MSSESKTQDWSKPAAMAIPKGGYFQDKVEQGRYGPIFPKTPACYGFSPAAASARCGLSLAMARMRPV
jgi:hypothetical protein